MAETHVSGSEVLAALREAQAALRKASNDCNRMADRVADLQRLLRHDHRLDLLLSPSTGNTGEEVGE